MVDSTAVSRRRCRIADFQAKSFDKPDDAQDFPGGCVRVVNFPHAKVALGIMEPGWTWRRNVQPVVGTDWCEVEHFEYVLTGRLGLKLRDGTEHEIRAGQVVHIPAGHEGWVIGDESFSSIDLSGTGARLVLPPVKDAEVS